MAVILTGGAGFIGSCLLRMLNDKGINQIYVVDNIRTSEKWRHLVNKKFLSYISKNELLEKLPQFAGKISHVIHMGACSSTTERDFDYLYRNNVAFTQMLWDFCADNGCSFIYASSAATYGDGTQGFDDTEDINQLRPLNGYGYSKQFVDQWVEKQEKKPKQHVGLKFFNVYGPNEDCKDDMASVVFKAFHQIRENGSVKLFKSHRLDYADGGQLRDFIYVKDICNVISYFMDHEEKSGLFNLGTGKARSFADLVNATFAAMEREPQIEYIDMPEYLRGKYQYFTEAKMEKLQQKAGYLSSFYTLEDGIKDYVQNYLMKGEIY